MTDNQERAKVELQRFGQLQSELRILELKYESALDDCQPCAAWPDIGYVPGGQHWPDATVYKLDDGTKLRLTKKVAPVPRNTHMIAGGRILSTVEARRRIETQMRVIHEQMRELEDLVNVRCDHDDAEVLIRNFCLGQSWSEIAEALGVSVRTVANRYSRGLEAFGSQIA